MLLAKSWSWASAVRSARRTPSRMPRSNRSRSGSAEALVRVVLVGLDALADEDDVAVGDREQDAGEPLDPLGDGRVLEPGVGDPVGDLVERLGGERGEQRIAGGVVAIERRAADARRGRDLAHARVVLGEEMRRGLEDRGARPQVERRGHGESLARL